MKLEILQENLSRGISSVCRILTSHPQIPILANVLFKASMGQLEIVASNLETTIVVGVGAKVEKTGEFTVPGRSILEMVNGLSADKLDLELKEGFLALSGGKFKGKLSGTPAAEFPKLFEGESANKQTAVWEINKTEFQTVVGRLAFAAAADESRAVLTGVVIKSDKNGLVLAATDGFRLSVDQIKTSRENKDELKFILPARALNEVARVLGEEKNNDENKKVFRLVYFEEKNEVVFEMGDTKIISRLIAGNFPDYEKIIPSSSQIKIVSTTGELSKAVRLAAIFARESANIVKLRLEKGKLKISANAPQVGENESEMDVTLEKGGGEEFSIAFNYRYLLDLFSCLEETEICLGFNGPLTSGVFTVSKHPSFLHIIMPVRVQA